MAAVRHFQMWRGKLEKNVKGQGFCHDSRQPTIASIRNSIFPMSIIAAKAIRITQATKGRRNLDITRDMIN